MAKLRQALKAHIAEDDPDAYDHRWLPVAAELWEDEISYAEAARQLRCAREAGAFGALPELLAYRAGACANAGELAECALACEEAEAIAAAAGVTLAPYWSFVLLAWRGDIARALEVMTPVMQTATQRGEGGVLIWAHVMMTLLYNGVGHHALALAAAQKVEIHDERLMSERLLPELVEAAARSGNRELAAAATAQLTERTHAADTDWALGTEAKARALTTDGPAAEALYREAIERLSGRRVNAYLARAHLDYGGGFARSDGQGMRAISCDQPMRRSRPWARRVSPSAVPPSCGPQAAMSPARRLRTERGSRRGKSRSRA